jgi:hypothetical protein
MWSMVRSVLGVVVGVVVAMILIVALELVSSAVYFAPAGIDPANREALKKGFAGLPVGALLLVLAGYALGTFSGALLAAAVAGRAPVTHGMIIGVLFLAAGIYNLMVIEHPLWFCMASVAVFLPAAYLGAKLAPGAKT